MLSHLKERFRTFGSKVNKLVRNIPEEGEVRGDEEKFFDEFILPNECLRSKTLCAHPTISDGTLWDSVLRDVNILRRWRDQEGEYYIQYGRSLNDDVIWICMTPDTNGKTKIIALTSNRMLDCVLSTSDTHTSIVINNGHVYSWTHLLKQNVTEDGVIYRTVQSQVEAIEKTSWGTIKTRKEQLFRDGKEIAFARKNNSEHIYDEIPDQMKEACLVEICKTITIEKTKAGEINKTSRVSLFKNGEQLTVSEIKENPSNISIANTVGSRYSEVSTCEGNGGIPIPGTSLGTGSEPAFSELPSCSRGVGGPGHDLTSTVRSEESWTYRRKTSNSTPRKWFSNVIEQNLDRS